MIERLYVSNYRCLENFTLDLVGRESALIIGKNGSGKSTVRQALGVFQKICRGPNSVSGWINESDFAQGRKHIPIRFELDVKLSNRRMKYAIAFEWPESSREPQVKEEVFSEEGVSVFSRDSHNIALPDGTTFVLLSSFAVLPLMGGEALECAVKRFRAFCASMVLINPIPPQMSGFSENESFYLDEHARNFADWLVTLLRRKPESYRHILSYLQEIIPDVISFENMPRGEKGALLLVNFHNESVESRQLPIEFKNLSDGEKCFFLSALVLASNRVNGPVFCFWDEPDSHLSLLEIDHFIMHLRKMTNFQGQFLAASHHPQVIRGFSDENTIVLTRKSHLEPTVVRLLIESKYQGDLINAIIRDEVIG